MRTVGVVVNPIAGMGGRVGLKGTDDKVAEARERGAEPRAPERAVEALRALAEHGGGSGDGSDSTSGDDGDDLCVLAWDGAMGADEAREAGLDPEVVGEPESDSTTAADTRAAVRAFAERSVDLVLFAGGDGTAVDVATALDEAGTVETVPVLGVPAGVKVYSAVFAVTPREAGRIATTFEATEPAEVNDLDEDAYREGEVRSELRAVVQVPADENRQAAKQLAGGSVEGLAAGVAEDARASPETTYVFGPGGTVGTIEEALGVDGSPLGVDVWRDGELLVRDGGESELLAALGGGDRVAVVVSPVGGQGFVFGRGNLQLSPAVLRLADEITVVASRSKLDDLGVLRVDTGDPELDEELRGWHRVRVGRFEHRLVEVV